MKRKEPPPAPQRLHKFAARTNPTLKIEKSTASTTSVDGACGVDTFASKGESTTTLSSIGKQGIESGEDGMRSDVDDKVSVSTEAKRSNTPSVHDEEEDDAASWVAGNESLDEDEGAFQKQETQTGMCTNVFVTAEGACVPCDGVTNGSSQLCHYCKQSL